MNLREMRDTLRGEPKADEAIFWFAYTWHRGKGSDLYHVLCEIDFTPSPNRKFNQDTEMAGLFSRLETAYGPMREVAYKPVALTDVEPGDILVAGKDHLNIPNRWPCKVFPWGGMLAVMDNKGVHPLVADSRGMVLGFRR